MELTVSGATRLTLVIGDPIAQVKSPAGISGAFARRGEQRLAVPVHVPSDDLARVLAAVEAMRNVDGLIVTVPHKFACLGACRTVTERARFIGAVNLMRRHPEGGWHGDMSDGLGMVDAIRGAGFEPRGKRTLLVGAGGAGSAIAHALVEAGVASLGLHDADSGRRDALTAKLDQIAARRIATGSADPSGYDLVVNASPAGMRSGDDLPVDVSRLSGTQFVACVITVPDPSPWVAAARALGCGSVTGLDMFRAAEEAITRFLLGET